MQLLTMEKSRKSSRPQLHEQEAIQTLEAEFSRLDGALIATIYYDTHSVDAARETLGMLNGETTIDDAVDDDGDSSPAAANSCPEWWDWGSDTDPTTVSLADDDEDPNEEIRALHAMFPSLRRYTLAKTLERCGGDHERAVDELLNRAFLEEGEEQTKGKGVDGFGEEVNRFRTGKKKKLKGKTNNGAAHHLGSPSHRRMSLPPEGTENTPMPPSVSVWDKKNEEIQFIAESLGLPKSAVASAHHANGGTMARTLAALLDTHSGEAFGDREEQIAELDELVQEFGGDVKMEYLERLLRLCKDNKVAVFHLAELLRRNSMRPKPLQIAASRATLASPAKATSACPHRPRDQGQNWTVVGTSMHATPISHTYQKPLDAATAAQISGNYRHARNEAFQKAADFYRRSRSDRLMAGAAAFYADLGHDYNTKTKEYDNLAAERHVNENSGDGILDLHGVTVAQAVKIAKERTTQWWVETPHDEKSRGVKPFRIVTGLGRHSKDGEARLAPAVSKMLQREKWNIKVVQGEILVYGVRR